MQVHCVGGQRGGSHCSVPEVVFLSFLILALFLSFLQIHPYSKGSFYRNFPSPVVLARKDSSSYHTHSTLHRYCTSEYAPCGIKSYCIVQFRYSACKQDYVKYMYVHVGRANLWMRQQLARERLDFVVPLRPQCFQRQ